MVLGANAARPRNKTLAIQRYGTAQVYQHASHTTVVQRRFAKLPALYTPKTKNEVAGAQNAVAEHATPSGVTPSGLPKLAIVDRNGKIGGEPSDASLSPPPTDKDGERGALHREKEHGDANVAATPEGSISPKTTLGTPENETEEATSRHNGDGPSASRLTTLLSELQPLRCSPSADQDSEDSDGPPRTRESTISMPSSSTSPPSDRDVVYVGFQPLFKTSQIRLQLLRV
ncbi:uncharacterized protein BBA_09051 [Beauveria bassiana ARSEF 2860]|uniref:Uncharacterized protein n=1 Tax=Beauveria bassiana (strain ARSEF 2860) TaxID=655819 RepID=J5J631_BEAB2|nr:uncharacterized protein BBA_09051 [Beauveria bassiana ARSEF 2860]EJP62003.1 hypothetical protein BBA_09051 [Beauveria bassiana ARSEF 2860]